MGSFVSSFLDISSHDLCDSVNLNKILAKKYAHTHTHKTIFEKPKITPRLFAFSLNKHYANDDEIFSQVQFCDAILPRIQFTA